MNREMEEEIRKVVFSNPREFPSGYFASFVLSEEDKECVKAPLKDSLKLEEEKRSIAYEKHLIPYVAQSESFAAESSSCPALKLYRKEDIGPEIADYLDRLADEVKATNDQNAAVRLLDVACALSKTGDAKEFAARLQFEFKHDILTAINIAASYKKSLVDVLLNWVSFSNSLLSEGITLLVAGRQCPDITGLTHYGIHLIERTSLTDALVFAAHLLSYKNPITQSLYDRWIAENKDKLPSSVRSAAELVQVLEERLSSLFAPQFPLTETYRLVLCAMPAEDVQSRTLKSKTNSCLRKIFLASMARGNNYGLSEAIVWDMSSRSEYEQTKDVFLVLLKVYQMVAFADDERKSTSPLMQRFKAQAVIRHLFDELSLVQPRNFILADYSSVDDEDTIELMSVVDKILRFVRVALEKTEFGPLYEARLQAAFHITKAFFKIFVEGESVNIIPFSNTLLQPDACEKLISLISSEATKYPQRTHWYKRWQAAVNATVSVSVGDRGNTARPNSSAAMSSAASGRSCSLARGHGQTSHPQSPAPSPAVSSLASAVRGKRPFESVSNAVPSPPKDIRTGTISQGSEAIIQSTTESATMRTDEGLEAAATRSRRAVKKLDLDAVEKHGDDVQPSPQSHDLLVFDDDQKQQPQCHELPPSPPKKRRNESDDAVPERRAHADEENQRDPERSATADHHQHHQEEAAKEKEAEKADKGAGAAEEEGEEAPKEKEAEKADKETDDAAKEKEAEKDAVVEPQVKDAPEDKEADDDEHKDPEEDVSTDAAAAEDAVKEPPRKKVRVRKAAKKEGAAHDRHDLVEQSEEQLLSTLLSIPFVADDDDLFVFANDTVLRSGINALDLRENDDPRAVEFFDAYVSPILRDIFGKGESIVTACRTVYKLRLFGCPIASPLLSRKSYYFKEENTEDILEELGLWLAKLVVELKEIRLTELQQVTDDVTSPALFCKKSKTKKWNVREPRTDRFWDDTCSLAIMGVLSRSDDVVHACIYCAQMCVKLSVELKLKCILEGSRLKKWCLLGQPVTVNRKRAGFSCDAIGFTRLGMRVQPARPSGQFARSWHLDGIRTIGSHCNRCVLLVTEQNGAYVAPITCLTRGFREEGEPGSVKGSRAQIVKLNTEAEEEYRRLHPNADAETVAEGSAEIARKKFREQRWLAIRNANRTKYDLKHGGRGRVRSLSDEREAEIPEEAGTDNDKEAEAEADNDIDDKEAEAEDKDADKETEVEDSSEDEDEMER